MTTCQICGREIKAKTGTIAHHGYQRPGEGWQTSSCYGAKRVPYEVGHDAIDSLLARLPGMIDEAGARLISFQVNPPATLMGRPNGFTGKADELNRPEGFDSNNLPTSYRPSQRYELAYANRLRAQRNDIKGMNETVVALTERRENWVAK